MGDNRDFHFGKIQIQPKLLRAIALRSAIKPADLLADQPKFRRVLETYFFRHGFSRRVFRKFAVTRRLSPRSIDDTRFSAALIRRDMPPINCRGHQHRPGLCSQFAILLK